MKRIVCIFLAILAVVALSGCGRSNQTNPPTTTVTPKTDPAFDLAAFKSVVAQSLSDIVDTSNYLANLGNYEYTFWKIHGSLSDNMTKFAYEWLDENSDATKESIESDYQSIRQQYKDITLTEYSGKEAETIYSAYESLYQAYVSLYHLVNSPSGSITDFNTNLNNYIKAITENRSELLLFLD